jgi:hypothetical protein
LARARRDQGLATFDRLLAGTRAPRQGSLPLPIGHGQRVFQPLPELNAFAAKYLLEFVGDVGVFPANDARPTLNDRHSATETTIGLCDLEADIAAAEHDQVRSVDVGERACGLEAGDLGIAACDPVFRNTRSPVRCD